MMYDLESPDLLPCSSIQGNDRIGIAVISRAHGAIKVRGSAAGGEIDAEMTLQTFPAPARIFCFSAKGNGSQVQRSFPEMASYPRTTPDSMSTCWLSPTVEPTITTVGGGVIP